MRAALLIATAAAGLALASALLPARRTIRFRAGCEALEFRWLVDHS